MTLLTWKHTGTTTGVLEWKGTGSFFRKARQEWWGGGVALWEWSWSSTLWWMRRWLKVYRSRWKGRRAGTDDIIVQACHRSLDQEGQGDEAFCSKTEWPQGSQALVFMGDFKQPSVCWKDDTAGHRQSSSLLECIDPFLLQVTDEPTRRSTTLDLAFTSKKEVVGNMKLKRSLCCRDHKAVKF